MQHFVNFGKNSKSPCWDGYEMKGKKMKGGRLVNNCVKKKPRKDEAEFTGVIAPPSDLKLKGGHSVSYGGDDYEIGQAELSDRKNKKYRVAVKNLTTGDTKTVNWGAQGYDDFYSHQDDARRERFLKRAEAIRTKDGNLASENPNQSNYYATKYSW